MLRKFSWNGMDRILAVMVLLAAGTTCLHAQACSNDTLRGGFGFKVTGTNTVRNVLFAITGRFEADGKGSITGVQVESVGGTVFATPFTATYTVNSDCTGNSAFTFPNGLVVHLFFVLVDNGNEAIIIDIGQGTVETGTAKKQFPTRRREIEE